MCTLWACASTQMVGSEAKTAIERLACPLDASPHVEAAAKRWGYALGLAACTEVPASCAGFAHSPACAVCSGYLMMCWRQHAPRTHRQLPYKAMPRSDSRWQRLWTGGSVAAFLGAVLLHADICRTIVLPRPLLTTLQLGRYCKDNTLLELAYALECPPCLLARRLLENLPSLGGRQVLLQCGVQTQPLVDVLPVPLA